MIQTQSTTTCPSCQSSSDAFLPFAKVCNGYEISGIRCGDCGHQIQ